RRGPIQDRPLPGSAQPSSRITHHVLLSMTLLLFRLARWLVPRVPVSFAYRLAEIGGDLLWLVARGWRADIEHNQWRAIGPGATRRRVALNSRQVLRNLARLYVDEFRVPTLTGEALWEVVDVRGLEYVTAALSEGHGMILASAHYGAPQLVAQSLAVRGYPLTVPVEQLEPEALFRLMCELRSSHGIRLMPVGQPLIPLLRTLRKENGIVALALDRNLTGTGICLPFLGEPTLMPDGAVRLALRARVPIVVGWCRRAAGNRYEARLEPVDLPEEMADVEEAAREAMARVVARLESFIRAEPEQWLLTVPLWKDSCEGPE
ncbi:MAG: lysophospholipid acyltransferase family protein, partial [Ardenticatenaceae bacterium]